MSIIAIYPYFASLWLASRLHEVQHLAGILPTSRASTSSLRSAVEGLRTCSWLRSSYGASRRVALGFWKIHQVLDLTSQAQLGSSRSHFVPGLLVALLPASPSGEKINTRSRNDCGRIRSYRKPDNQSGFEPVQVVGLTDNRTCFFNNLSTIARYLAWCGLGYWGRDYYCRSMAALHRRRISIRAPAIHNMQSLFVSYTT